MNIAALVLASHQKEKAHGNLPGKGALRAMTAVALALIVFGPRLASSAFAGADRTKEERLPEIPADAVHLQMVNGSDGCHWVYQVRDGKGVRVVADGKPGPLCDRVEKPVFSPDGKRLVYAATKGEMEFVVTDGVEGEHFDSLRELVFSSNSKRIAYIARKAEKQFVVVDGKPCPAYEVVAYVTFSPDGNRLAYAAKKGMKGAVVWDGEEGPAFEDFDEKRGLIFSPDGKLLSYVVRPVLPKVTWLTEKGEVEVYPGVGFGGWALV
jgi:hypothetical protein